MPTNTTSEQYRHECEAREVMQWPREQREWYYRQVAEKRGIETSRRLAMEVSKQWKIAEQKK